MSAPPSDPTSGFGGKLAAVLERLNISRGQVAARVQVDKSVVSRWVRGQVKPSDHNLTQLTAFIAERAPVFSRRNWALSPTDFRKALEAATAEAPSAPAGDSAALAGEWLPKAAEQSRNETARDGDRYPGLYVQVRHRFANTLIFADLVPIWREADQLRVKFDGPFWAHTGRIFILGHQLFMVAEDRAVSEGLWVQVMNGVSDGKAMAMDGVLTTVPHDRSRAPGATLTLMLRVADLADPNREPPADLLTAFQDRIATLVEEGQVEALAGPEIIRHVSNRIGEPREDGVSDHILRAPASRGMTVSSRDRAPLIEAAISRWRAALGDLTA